MIVTTTPSIEDHKIVDYRGIVTGEAILGANPEANVALPNPPHITAGKVVGYKTR